MRPSTIARLLPIVEAQYEAEFAAIQHIFDDETRCRKDLARLDDMAQSLYSQALRPGAMEIIGADVLFQKSLAANRSRINAELARVLVRKEMAMEKVRQAFGRKNALEKVLSGRMEIERRQIAVEQQRQALEPWLRQGQKRNKF